MQRHRKITGNLPRYISTGTSSKPRTPVGLFNRLRINGRIFLLSEDEFMKLVLGMTPANPVDVLDFIGGRNRGERQHCRSPLFTL